MPLIAYDLVRCGACGVPWDLHTPECTNHRNRPGEAVPADSVDVLVGVDDIRGFNLILRDGNYVVEPQPGTGLKLDNPFVFRKL